MYLYSVAFFFLPALLEKQQIFAKFYFTVFLFPRGCFNRKSEDCVAEFFDVCDGVLSQDSQELSTLVAHSVIVPAFYFIFGFVSF